MTKVSRTALQDRLTVSQERSAPDPAGSELSSWRRIDLRCNYVASCENAMRSRGANFSQTPVVTDTFIIALLFAEINAAKWSGFSQSGFLVARVDAGELGQAIYFLRVETSHTLISRGRGRWRVCLVDTAKDSTVCF